MKKVFRDEIVRGKLHGGDGDEEDGAMSYGVFEKGPRDLRVGFSNLGLINRKTLV